MASHWQIDTDFYWAEGLHGSSNAERSAICTPSLRTVFLTYKSYELCYEKRLLQLYFLVQSKNA